MYYHELTFQGEQKEIVPKGATLLTWIGGGEAEGKGHNLTWVSSFSDAQ